MKVDGVFPLPSDEIARLAALHRYAVIDTGDAGTLDRVAHMASSLFGAALGVITFVEVDRVQFKAGCDLGGFPRHVGFCAHTILSDDVLVVPDASLDPRFCDNPAVAGEPHMRFYAGAPLITRDGYRIGTVCVIDMKPHADLAAEARDQLVTLARLVMNELDLRLELRARIEAERDLDLVNRLMTAIAEAPTAHAALQTSIKLIATAVDATYGSVWTMNVLSDRMQMVAVHSPAEPAWLLDIERVRQASLKVAGSISGLVFAKNEPAIFADIKAAAERFPQLRGKVALGITSLIIVPVFQSGHYFAFHFCFSSRPADMEGLAKRLALLADRIRPALARKQSEESISLLQSVVLNADDAAIVMRPNNTADPGSPWHIVYVNPATTQMTGFEPEELYGMPPAFLWGQDTDLGGGVFEQSGPTRFELFCHRKDGSTFWADISAIPADGDTEGGRKLIALMRDTSERRELEQALREREQTFHTMFSNAPIPMMLFDLKSHRYLEVNNYATELFGYSREQFLLMEASDIRAPDEAERWRAMMNTPLPPSGRRGLWRYRKADGSEIMVDVAVHPFRFEGRWCALTVTVDVTDQKRAEEQIRRARDEAETASRAKTDLLANMSHELRTPLNAIIGFSQIMKEELFGPVGTPRYQSYIGDILESAYHLLTVINDILDLAKIEANSFRLREDHVELGHMVASAIRLVRPRAEEARIAISVGEHAPFLLHADETALKRIFVNLLANAVKFSEAGTSVTVTSQIDATGDLHIAVIDRGIGMSPDEIPVALTPFRQVDIGLRRKYEGTGLGLPIAKDLVELHGGRLMIESAPGVGTTVTVILPASRLVSPAEALAQSSDKMRAMASRTAPTGIAAISLLP